MRAGATTAASEREAVTDGGVWRQGGFQNSYTLQRRPRAHVPAPCPAAPPRGPANHPLGPAAAPGPGAES